MITPAVALLLFVTLQRLLELRLAARNTARLLARGAREHGRKHYPLLVAIHVAWLASLWLLGRERDLVVPFALLYLVLQVGRWWVIRTLGARWTTRIIVLHHAPLVRAGPYRFVRHPNYWIVAAEVVVLPMAFGLVELAVVFGLLNAVALWIRVREEERALAPELACADGHSRL